MSSDRPAPGLRESATFDRYTIHEIQRAARTGIYHIRGWGAKRPLPHFDDLVVLGASMSRYPLEGYRERCDTDVVLGTRHARNPIHLDIPVTIAGMSFGALSAQAKEALGRGASAVGTSTTTGDGGMTAEERAHSRTLVYQLLPSRYGMNPDDLRRADAIEVVLGQGAKPGGGGMLLGQKMSERVAQEVFIEHVGIPTLAALRQAVEALDELEMHRKVQLVVSGGIRSGADVAKALAMGADACSIGTAALIALGDNSPELDAEYRKIGSAAGFYDDLQDGRDPAGISTQDDSLARRLDPEVGGRRIANYLRVMTMEAQTIARACGKSHVHNLEPEDLAALTVEAAAMAKIPLAGTDWIPGAGEHRSETKR